MTIYETWEERDGATMRQRVGTDAPAGVRLVLASDYEALEAEKNSIGRTMEDAIDRVAELEAELQAVMHSVDKWFDEVPNDNPATRATDAREIALQAIERVEAKNQRLREALREYASKSNWRRNYDGVGHLNVFQADTNGPYIALEAITEQGENREDHG